MKTPKEYVENQKNKIIIKQMSYLYFINIK